MNPNANLNLPPPVAELPSAPLAPEAAPVPVSAEQMMVPSPEAVAQRAPAAPPSQSQDDPMQLLAPAQQSSSAGAVPAAATPAASDDVADDKIWIEKAKRIVMQTMADPYEQNKQLAVVKADYLQTRYGKQIKLAE